MIESFKSKPIKLLLEKDDNSKIRPDFIRKVENILTRLQAAKEIKDMNAPCCDLHEFKGNRKVTWSVAIKGNWKITFRFRNGDAFDVNMEDYH
jgi:proteic killer suppression protein